MKTFLNNFAISNPAIDYVVDGVQMKSSESLHGSKLYELARKQTKLSNKALNGIRSSLKQMYSLPLVCLTKSQLSSKNLLNRRFVTSLSPLNKTSTIDKWKEQSFPYLICSTELLKIRSSRSNTGKLKQ